MPTLPFVLLDDARPGGAARLYRDPAEVLEARTPAEVRAVMARLRKTGGLHAAGFLAYEAAAAFEPSLPAPPGGALLAWFGLFTGFEDIDAAAWLPDPAGAHVGAPRPSIGRAAYDARFAAVQALIAAGDVYQANLTFPAAVAVAGDPLAAFAAIRARAAAGWGAVVATGQETILSFSPELFFALDGRDVIARPMKGTARRLPDPADDARAAAALAADSKQRAENLMIVDLIRNDLSRVAAPGSVAVPALFAVERYPTVHQMTSTVTARLADGRDAADLIAAAFPCGSITGAPKLRAIEALAGIEDAPRGVYTGAIGRVDADGDAQFNVAIRTLTVRHAEAAGHSRLASPAKAGAQALASDRTPAFAGEATNCAPDRGSYQATIGLGGGIVADSRPDEEWDEALAKGAFLTAGQRRIDLIETMAFDPAAGIALLERHLARLTASAAALGFGFDRHAARNELQAATFRLREPRRVRLLLAASGALAVEVGPLPSTPARMETTIVPLPVASHDFRLRHKTSDRAFYDAARRAAKTAEVLFEDSQGFLTEGSFTSLFVERGGRLLTPPLVRGLLPGVLRAELTATGRAVEADLTRADLTGGFLIGNALRGLIPAVVAVAKEPAPRL